jgi:hypothetical protein
MFWINQNGHEMAKRREKQAKMRKVECGKHKETC